MSAAALLELQDISLSFKGVRAISDISFAVAEGEICALIGPNGAGKSSLLNVINGVYQPQQGLIRFAGRERRAMRPHDAALGGIARTFQNIALFKGMSVLDNVLTGRNLKRRAGWLEQALRLGRAPGEDDRQREAAEQVLAFLRIQPWRDAIVGRLPYGLQKRVELARALAAEPRLLLLDEPSMGLAPQIVEEIFEIVAALNREEGVSFLIAEQNIEVALRHAHHAYVLESGRVVDQGPAQEIARREDLHAFYLGGQAAQG